MQINSNVRVELKAFAADRTTASTAHDRRAGNSFWPSRFGKHDRLTGVSVIYQAREMGLGLVHVDHPLLRTMAKTSSAPACSAQLKKVNAGSTHLQNEFNICKDLEISIHAEEPSL